MSGYGVAGWATGLFVGLTACAWIVTQRRANKDATFAKRIAWQIVIVVLALWPAALGKWAFLASLCIAAALCAREVDQTIKAFTSRGSLMLRLGTPPLIVVMLGIGFIPTIAHVPSAIFVTCGVFAIAWPWVLRHAQASKRRFLVVMMGAWPVYALLPLALFASHSSLLMDIAFLYGVIEVNDSAAFVAGKAFGKHRLAPLLSPGKTWEGFVVGILAASGAGYGLSFCVPSLLPWQCAVAAALLACIGVAGDLSASAFKRAMNVKDFGSALGPHGGVLDAYDAVILAAPFWCAYLNSAN